VRITKRPQDELVAMAAPRELVEWFRKLPGDTALRAAWVDATRADWMPYLAVLRGFDRDVILRTTCQLAVEIAGPLTDPEGARVLAVLRAAANEGRAALATTEVDLADLKLAIIAATHRTQPRPRPPWMHWAELALELARAASRGNPLVGIALAMRMLAHARTRGRLNARPAHLDLVARFRDKLIFAG
jgi:hypothetical protein